jgi:hypothetical protein
LDAGDRALPYGGFRSEQFHAPDLCGGAEECGSRGLNAGSDGAPQVLAGSRDRIHGDRRSEVHDDHRLSFVHRVRCDCVGDAVRANLSRIVRLYGDARSRPRLDHDGREAEVAIRHLAKFLGGLRHDRRDRHSGYLSREGQLRQREELTEHKRKLVCGACLVCGRAPLVGEVVALEDPQLGLRIPHIDR